MKKILFPILAGAVALFGCSGIVRKSDVGSESAYSTPGCSVSGLVQE